MEAVKKLVSTKTTKKAFWGFIAASGLFVGVCVVFKLNDAKMDDFHRYLDFAWKAIGTFLTAKAYIDRGK